jgi:SAM-dependent methyltransferase
VTDAIIERVEQYYTDRVRKFGATAAGVDWKDEVSQELRFAQFDHLWGSERAFSLNDLGCGYAALFGYLRRRGFKLDYYGIDVSAGMLDQARRLYGRSKAVNLVLGTEAPAQADYTVASGIFNVKGETDAGPWREYVFRTIRAMAESSRSGFAFNVLSDHSDKHLQRPDLFYMDPAEAIDFCGRSISRHVHLAQDYGLYEFTLCVRL